MKKISDRKCPDCGSEKVHDTGKHGDAGNLDRNGAAIEPTHPIFVCDECEARFVTG